ncbi:hypothetical protein EYS14_10850 [Alteromonadaceae bacterium M269]|nr:hypothetical protein EYS14_10850 [Alteromonadaceae bacterium M269]
MFELLKSEYARYKNWSYLAFVIVLGAFGFIAKLKPFLQEHPLQTAATNMVFIGGAFIFGVLQMALHRRANHWTYLIHRPLSTLHIYSGLTLAGLLLISSVVVVPMMIMVVGTDVFSASVVDSRHYVYILFLMLTATLAYLVGQLAALSASKGILTFAMLFVPILAPRHVNNIALLLPVTLLIAGVLYLNVKSFKPDLSRYLQNPLSILLLAVPMSLSFVFILLMSTTLFYHVPKFIAGTHSDNNPQNGTMRYIWQFESKDRPSYILENSDHPLAKNLMGQTELAEATYLDFDVWTFPRRGQMHVEDRIYALVDSETNTTWQFSHASMLLEGRQSTNGESIGALGENGFVEDLGSIEDSDRFTQVPYLIGKEFVMTQETLYKVNFEERSLDIKFALRGDEVFISPPQFRKEDVVISTNKRLMLFAYKDIMDGYDLAQPDYVIDHPVALENLRYVFTYRVAAGYMLLYFGNDYFGFDKPGAEIILASLGGEKAESIHQRRFELYGHPAWIRHFNYLISPALYYAQFSLLNALEPQDLTFASFERIRAREYPQRVIVISIILQILSGLITLLLVRAHKQGKAHAITWVILATGLGLPALCSFILLNPWHPTSHVFSLQSKDINTQTPALAL